MSGNRKLHSIAAAGLWLVLAKSACAQTQMLGIGRIVIDEYVPKPYESLQRGPGARIIAHFEPNDNFWNQTCCDPENVHWLQSLFSNPGIPGVSPLPNRRIIDPRKDQRTPGTPSGKGDEYPFYDFTYPSLEDVQRNTNIDVEGGGAYMQDTPRVAAGQTDVTVNFTTVLVCEHEEKELCMLGGFRWGFRIDARSNSTLLPITPLRSDEVLLGKYADLNSPMREDFNGYVVKNQKLCCPDRPMYVGVVPEPSSMAAFGLFGLGLLARRRGAFGRVR